MELGKLSTAMGFRVQFPDFIGGTARQSRLPGQIVCQVDRVKRPSFSAVYLTSFRFEKKIQSKQSKMKTISLSNLIEFGAKSGSRSC